MQKKIRRFLALMMALMIALMMLFPLLAIATEPIAVDVSESIRLSPSDSPAPEAPEETIPESGADETEEIPLPEVNGEPQPDVSAQPDSAPVTGAPDETEASAESDPSFEGAGETIVSEENAAPDGEDGALGISLSETDSPLPEIRIVKRDQLTGEALAGAEFTVTRLSAPPSHNGAGVGDVVAVLTTGADGTAETGWLDWGKYRVEETKVPDHYVDNYFSIEIDAYENGATYEITVENEPTKGFIRLTKTDRLNGNPIEGVRFDIYYNDEYGTGLATTMVTDKDGIAISEPLRKGKYIVREHGETMGYVFEEIALDATVKSDETTELAATNQPVMVRLKLYKRDAEEYEGDIADISTRGDGELTGAEFQALAGENITDRQGNVLHAKGDVVIASVKTSGEDASVTTGELWPGLYEIVELSPPVGYRPSSGRFYVDAQTAAFQSTEAVITYDGLVTNKILYGVLGIVKFLGDNLEHVGSGVVETPEQGAEFEVYIKSAGSYENAREFERDYLKTNRYGKAKTKALPYGVYVLRQVVGAEGHAFMEPIEFMIDGTEDLQDPPSLILNNQAVRYRLHIAKMDAETNQPIPQTKRRVLTSSAPA